MGTNPLLANALDLDRWADTRESQGAFPELMRRLLAQTPGITNIDIRAHEGTAAPGWDGTATSDGSSFLPKGELRFEFGTNKQPKTKADDDYEKRVEKVTGKSDEIFVFATPRNWAGAASWAEIRRREEVFASVEAYDAHRLEGWLQSIPAVHYWLSEKLGKPVSGVQTLTSWWEGFRGNCTIKVPPDFHTAGRHNESERLMQLLGRQGTVPTVQAVWRNDTLAFCHAVLLQEDRTELERTLVVSNPEAWRYLAMQASPLILIPVFDNPDIGIALNNGHSVIRPIAEVNTGRNDVNSIKLSKIDRHIGYGLLVGTGLERSFADKLSALSRRSMSSFYRCISLDLHRSQPEWAKDRGTVAVLAPLALVGTWDADHSGDRDAISNFVNEEVDEINLLLDELLDKYPLDPPFIRSGGRWRMVDAVDAAALLLPKLSESHTACWKKFAEFVLTCEDPLEGLSFKEAVIAQCDARKSLVSSPLRQGVARSLVLAATSSKQTGRMRSIGQGVDEIVTSLLSAVLHDGSGRVLNHLAPYLPFLAEASPRLFLQFFDDGLIGEMSVMTLLFQSAEFNVLNSSVSVHSFLMAIECLCWSPDFFGKAVRLAVLLTDLAPNQKVRDECLDTLDKVLSIRTRSIDKDTTGVIVVCKTDKAHNSLAEQLKEHSITRKYHAIVYNNFTEDEGTVDAPIGRSMNDRKKMAINRTNGRNAVTHYKVLKRFGQYTYIECQLETGRTHQIRVHMASIGHPLLGDTVYGPAKSPFGNLQGQTLHAKVLGFVHPTTGEYVEFDTPLPEYFKKLLDKLEIK